MNLQKIRLHDLQVMSSIAIVILFVLGLFPQLMAQDGNETPRPNIVLFMADDAGDEVFGAYGGESYDTPNIDSIAETGTLFTHAFSTPRCSPSRATLLTGRYTFRYPHKWGHLPSGEITFGNVLRDAGYATAAAGKWQMGLLKEDPLQPRKEGFNRYAFWGWHEGPRYYDPLVWMDAELVDDPIEDRYGPDVFTDFLIRHIKRNRGDHQRFLAYFPLTLPHFANKDTEPSGPDGEYQDYEELVSNMDRVVGRILDALEKHDLRENTLVLFTSDNGTPKKVTVRAKDKTFKGGKGKLTNAGTHVPLLASWPGQVPQGRVSNALIDFSDILPTLADLAGASLPQDRTIDGTSFVPQLLGSDDRHREWIYTKWRDNAEWVRTHDWKLYRNGELYHVAEDVKERNPIDPDSAGQEAKKVRKKLQKAFKELGRE